jgi:endonuclease/exonuclease/phosphatase family metal-dependent hydrolase
MLENAHRSCVVMPKTHCKRITMQMCETPATTPVSHSSDVLNCEKNGARAMPISLMTFNVNNLFLRYKFGKTFPGDMSDKSASPDPRWGYLPLYKPGLFEIFSPVQRGLAASAIWDAAGGKWPEILCLQEVESMHALRAFNENHLDGHYKHAALMDCRDLRQIDVGIISSLPILAIRSHMDEPDPQDADYPWLFSRDCVEVDVQLPSSEVLTVLNNHFKSKLVIESDPVKKEAKTKAARAKRKRQAQRAAQIAQERFAGSLYDKALFAVVGDLNDQPGSPAVQPLLADAGLDNVLDRLPPPERWTGYFKGGGEVSQLDYLLLSPKLSQRTGGALPGVERGSIGFGAIAADGDTLPRNIRLAISETQELADPVDFSFARYEGVSASVAASDHCPLCIDFDA